jgi:hypothetical protein
MVAHQKLQMTVDLDFVVDVDVDDVDDDDDDDVHYLANVHVQACEPVCVAA